MMWDKRQAAILSDRYLEILWGEMGSVLVLLAQAPIIGGLCGVVWGGIKESTESLFFVLALTAVWLGCINACREVVKERAILDRERLAGLQVGAYLASKFRVLSMLNMVQIVILLGMVENMVHPRGNVVFHWLAMFAGAEVGTAIGLVTSCLVSKQDRAVFMVPIIIIPQILFSEFVMDKAAFTETVRIGEKLMPVHWAFEAMRQSAKSSPDWPVALGSLLVVVMMIPVLMFVSGVTLKLQKPSV